MSEAKEKDELFEKDGFRLTSEQTWNGNKLKFTQWEAKYVGEIERENEHLTKLLQHVRSELNWERERFINRILEKPRKDAK